MINMNLYEGFGPKASFTLEVEFLNHCGECSQKIIVKTYEIKIGKDCGPHGFLKAIVKLYKTIVDDLPRKKEFVKTDGQPVPSYDADHDPRGE